MPHGSVSLQYRLERVEIRGNARTRERVIRRFLPFRAGGVLDVDDPEVELARFRLLGTGFFSKVSFSLRRGSERGSVVLVVDVVERNTIVVNDVWLGLSATADADGRPQPVSAYAGIDASETNLLGTGITLGGALALAEDQLAGRLRFADPSLLGSSWIGQGTLLYADAREFYGTRRVLYDDPVAGASKVQDFAIGRYQRLGGSLGLGHDITVATQIFGDYRLERVHAALPLAASHVRGEDVEPLLYHLLPGDSYLSTLRTTLLHDARDQPHLPTRGTHLQTSLDLGLAALGSSYPYAKAQVRISRWFPLRHGQVLRLEAFGGAISGSAPVFEKFYVADFSDLLPDRVLDLDTDRRPAPNFFRDAIAEIRFGDYAAKVQAEHRVALYRGSRSVYGIDWFTAAGLYAVADTRDITDPARGYAGIARLPVDFTFNLGLKMDTQAGGFVLSLANPLGFVPAFRGGGR